MTQSISSSNSNVVTLWEALPSEVLIALSEIDFGASVDSAKPAIAELLNRTVLEGGKRLRPLLTLLVGHLLNVPLKQIVPLARAIEQVHAASLAHDDVVDNATTRRGKDSINQQASNKRAVLAGDYLLADVIVNLTRTGNLELVREMSEVISALSKGEWLQLDALEKREYSDKILEEIFRCKTASVMSWCCLAPAVFDHRSRKIIELLRRFGDHLGIAFQMMDDALDFSSNSQKDQMLDIENNQVNAVTLEFLNVETALFDEYRRGANLIDLVRGVELFGFAELVKEKAQRHMEQAHALLNELAVELEIDLEDSSKNQRLLPLKLIMKMIISRQH